MPALCGSPHTTQQLGSGAHTFSVYARDAAENDDPTPATRAFNVVAAAPATTTTPTTTTPTITTPPPVDVLAPAVGTFRLSRTVFRAARSGPALAASLVGTRISVRLSEAATVTFRVARLVGGRSVRLRGRIVRALPAGTSRLRYRGRLAGRALRPGRYRLIVRARDAAGNVSSVRRVAFTIVR